MNMNHTIAGKSGKYIEQLGLNRDVILLTLHDKYEDTKDMSFVVFDTEFNRKVIAELQKAVDNYETNDDDNGIWDTVISKHIGRLSLYRVSNYEVIY